MRLACCYKVVHVCLYLKKRGHGICDKGTSEILEQINNFMDNGWAETVRLNVCLNTFWVYFWLYLIPEKY